MMVKEENERETLDWMGKEYSYDDDDGNFDDDAYDQDGDDDDGERETLDSSICVGKEGENPGKPVNSARRPYLNMHTAQLVMITMIILMMILIVKEKKMEAG